MSPILNDRLSKLISNDAPLRPDEAQFLLEAIEEAALAFSNRPTENTDEA